MGKRREETICSVQGALEQAQADLSDLASEIRDSADSMSESFPGTERTEQYEQAADQIESIDLELEMPEALKDRRMTYVQDTRRGLPRRARVNNLHALLDAIYEQAVDYTGELDEAEGEPDEEVVEAAEQFRDAVETARDEVDGVDL